MTDISINAITISSLVIVSIGLILLFGIMETISHYETIINLKKWDEKGHYTLEDRIEIVDKWIRISMLLSVLAFILFAFLMLLKYS